MNIYLLIHSVLQTTLGDSTIMGIVQRDKLRLRAVHSSSVMAVSGRAGLHRQAVGSGGGLHAPTLSGLSVSYTDVKEAEFLVPSSLENAPPCFQLLWQHL